MNRFSAKDVLFASLHRSLKNRELRLLEEGLDRGVLTLDQYTENVDELDKLFLALDSFDKLIEWNESQLG